MVGRFTGLCLFALLSDKEEHERQEYDAEDETANNGDHDLDAHDYLRTRAPSARIEGTHIPTKIPDVLSAKNHRTTEKQNEMNAARRNSITGAST